MKPKKYLQNAKAAFRQALDEKPLEKPKFKWKRALILIFLGILAYAVLKLVLALGFEYSFVLWFVYEGIASVCVIAYVIIVRGRVSSAPITPDMLPDDWSESQKSDFIALDLERRARGKIFITVAFPFIVAVMCGILTEIWWPMVSAGL